MDTLTLPISRSRGYIVQALAYAGDTHTADDVLASIAAGRMTLWPGPASAIVTEIADYPRQRHLHFFLAAGDRRELDAMTPVILDWGKGLGCTKATLIGRKGWSRSLPGWRTSPLVMMEKDL